MDHKYMKNYFTYKHLKPELAEISKPFCDLAHLMADKLPNNQETEEALKQLMRAKDSAVRAYFMPLHKLANRK